MDLDLAIRGSLANLPDGDVREAAFLSELGNHGLSEQDSRLALDKAALEGFVRRTGDGFLVRMSRARLESDAGRDER